MLSAPAIGLRVPESTSCPAMASEESEASPAWRTGLRLNPPLRRMMEAQASKTACDLAGRDLDAGCGLAGEIQRGGRAVEHNTVIGADAAAIVSSDRGRIRSENQADLLVSARRNLAGSAELRQETAVAAKGKQVHLDRRCTERGGQVNPAIVVWRAEALR